MGALPKKKTENIHPVFRRDITALSLCMLLEAEIVHLQMAFNAKLISRWGISPTLLIEPGSCSYAIQT